MSGVKVMRDAFNLAASGDATAQYVFLDYDRRPDDLGTVREYQILTFRGMRRDGSAFEVKSEPLLGEIDVAKEAAAVALKLIAPAAQPEGPNP